MSIRSDIGKWLLDLLGYVGIGIQGVSAAAAPDVAVLRQDALYLHPDVALSPADLAAAVLKGAVDAGAAADQARLSGIDQDRFDVITAITGNPPGPELLLNEWRKGRIDEATLTRGLRESYLRDEWVPFYTARRFDMLSASEYVAANVQGYVADNELVDLLGKLGVNADDALILQQSFGNPPGPTEVVRMLNRGLLTRDQATQALRESRLKDKYIPAVLGLADTLVPARTITTLVGHGAISDAQADERLALLGYDQATRAAFIASAHTSKASAAHEFTLANVRSLYADKVITRQQALDDLAKIGWPAADATLLLDLADSQQVQRYRATGVSKVHSLYVGYKIERPAALTDLDKIGIPSGQRDELLTLWDIERDANVKHLTVGELNQALKKGLIDEPTFLAYVQRMGYDAADAAILAAIDIGVTNNTTAGPAGTLPTGA